MGSTDIAPVVQANFLSLSAETTPAWLDYSGITGNRMYFDSAGKLTWAPHNLLLNSATLATQTVAVTVGVTNILSFYGTGSVALSGAATDTLAGTGANNRVSLIITPTTTSLVLTVTGSVTQAQLERVTYQTTPRPWISTGAAAVYLPRFTYDPATLLPIGLWSEESRINLALWSNDFTNTGWTKANVTIATNSVVAPTGLTVTKNTVSETGTSSAVYDLYQSITITSGANYALSGFVKKIGRRYVRLIISAASSGSAWVAGQFDLDTGTFVTQVGSGGGTLVSASMQDQGNGLYLLELVGSVADTAALFFFGSGKSGAISNTDIRGRTSVTGINGDAYNLFDAQIELGSFASSRIPTTTAVVTRAADVLKLSGVALNIANGAIGSAIVQTTKLALNSSSYIILGDSGNRRLIFSNQLGYNLASSYEGSATLAATFGSDSWTTKPSRAATGWDSFGRSIVANNGTVATDIKTFSSATNVFLGSDGGLFNINGIIASISLYNIRLPDATLKSKSIAGAAL